VVFNIDLTLQALHVVNIMYYCTIEFLDCGATCNTSLLSKRNFSSFRNVVNVYNVMCIVLTQYKIPFTH
jgi:hypothetical protein